MNRLKLRGSPALWLGLIGVLYLIWVYPGHLEPDSSYQLSQARSGNYDDWQPPVMALVWSILLKAVDNAGTLLAFHQVLYWLGFALLADAFFRAGSRTTAWVVGAIACFPLFLFYDRVIIKDVGLASSLICAVGVACWHPIQQKKTPVAIYLPFLLLLAYAALLRANAVFAIGPLLLLPTLWRDKLRVRVIVPLSILVAAALIPLSNLVNYRILGASESDRTQSIQLFDILGVASRSGDPAVLQGWPMSVQDAKDCYVSFWWDTMASYGSCAGKRKLIGVEDATEAQIAERRHRWLSAIETHPLAYLEHRAAFFNSSLYFLVPSYHLRWRKHPAALEDWHGDRQDLDRRIRTDYVKISAFVWPVTWLAVGIVYLAWFFRRDERTIAIGRLLVISGLLYAVFYALIGIATDVRYYLWSTVAILLACGIGQRAIVAKLRSRSRGAVLGALFIVLTVALGYAARLADIPLI